MNLKDVTIGIWTQDRSIENMQRLFNLGIRGTTIQPANNVEVNLNVENMFKFYLTCKEIGYTHFLIQMASEYSEYHDKVIAKFKGKADVEYLFGEPFDLVEKCGWDEDDLYIMLENSAVKVLVETGKHLLFDIQSRLWDKICSSFKSPSSYFWQQRKWYEGQPFCWIYGQLAWHSFIPFIGSSNYKRLKREMDKKGITVAYLYQGDEGKFTNLLNNFLLKRFLKVFGKGK